MVNYWIGLTVIKSETEEFGEKIAWPFEKQYKNITVLYFGLPNNIWWHFHNFE